VKDDRVYLEHILCCIRRVEEDTALGHAAFLSSHVHQDAALRNLQVLAESTQRISDAVKAVHPEVEWRSIAAFRNILVHDYLGVDLERIWEVTQKDVSALKEHIQAILAELRAGE